VANYSWQPYLLARQMPVFNMLSSPLDQALLLGATWEPTAAVQDRHRSQPSVFNSTFCFQVHEGSATLSWETRRYSLDVGTMLGHHSSTASQLHVSSICVLLFRTLAEPAGNPPCATGNPPHVAATPAPLPPSRSQGQKIMHGPHQMCGYKQGRAWGAMGRNPEEVTVSSCIGAVALSREEFTAPEVVDIVVCVALKVLDGSSKDIGTSVSFVASWDVKGVIQTCTRAAPSAPPPPRWWCRCLVIYGCAGHVIMYRLEHSDMLLGTS
jgi:hypothetical protein